MLPQKCSRIHYPLYLNVSSQKNQNSEKTIFENTLNICCFDYLINLNEFYSDNLMNNFYYYQFTKIVYNFDKKNLLDFSNYNKDSLFKFIIILSEVCCNYYIKEKIKYSKYLSNLSVRIIQNYFKKYINSNIIINNNKLNKKSNNSLNDLKINNLVSNIYNNACCNYFKTLSYNKCLKFLEYSNKNIEENDINNKLIYYNNALIISSKVNCNINIDNYIKIINKLILLKRKYFDNIYLNNIYSNNNNGNVSLKNNLKKNEDNYNNFKLLSFIMYNYGFALEKLLNHKKQAKKYYQSSYEYICKYLGKNSFEAQKFLFKINNNNKNDKYESFFYNINDDNNNILNENKKRNLTPVMIREKDNKNENNYDNNKDNDNDIDLRLNSILKKIENFEEILKNNEILNNIILNEKNIIKNKDKNDMDNNTIKNDLKINNLNNHEEKILNNKNEINNNKSNENINININNNNNLENKNKDNSNNKHNIFNEEIKLDKNENKINNNSNETKKENIKTDINVENKINLENNKDNKKNNKIKEKITFDMMDNIIEEFKKESQEKMEKQKKLKEEKEKEKKLKEENDKKEKEKENKEKENKDIKIKIDKVENNNNDETQPKKPLRIKKLFQKVLGRQEKEMPKTKLGELFQSLMKNPQNEKKKGMDEGGKEIKVGKESENNLINLDEDEDEDEIKVNNNNIKTEVENNYNDINKDNLNNKPKSGFGYKINVNLDKSEYSYDAVTFFQESNTSE